jgi:hypothetical protein
MFVDHRCDLDGFSVDGAIELKVDCPHQARDVHYPLRDVLAAGGPLDAFMAGDDAHAKANVSAFVTSLGSRPQDSDDLRMAHWLQERACCQ